MNLVTVVVAVLLAGAAFWILGLIPFPPEVAFFKTIAYVLVGLAFLFYVLDALGIWRYPRNP